MSNFELHAVGIGAQKAGSTWVAKILREHPDVAPWHPKELEFFNDAKSYYQQPRLTKYTPDIRSLSKFFDDPSHTRLHVEVSPNYFWDPNAAERIHALFPDIKIIANLREPVERAFSQFIMATYNHKRESREFEEVLQGEPEYVERGRYAKQLDYWTRFFPKEQIHIVLLDDIRNRPKETGEKMYSFLGLKNVEDVDFAVRSNSAKSTKWPRLQDSLNKMDRSLGAIGLGRLVHPIRNSRLKEWFMNKNQASIELPKFNPEYKAKYHHLFRHDIERLEEEWGLNLSSWKP